MAQTKLWYLKNFSMLSPLSTGEIIQLGRQAVMWEVKKNQVIYFPEDTANTVFMLKKGKIKISRYSATQKEVILAILGPGEIFGELSLAGQEKREDVAEATEDTLVCSVAVEMFQSMMENNPKFHLQITKLIGTRLKKIERRLERLIFKTSEQRIRFFLKELAEEHGREILFNAEEREIKLNLTHQDIAQLTATSRQTVTSVLSHLETQGIITYDRHRILVKKLSQLAE
jgi:CRP-like cAMP-binding protein